jgi:hypothetical protein
VPISYREWKGKADNPHVVPESVKNLLWDEILKHFTLSEGVEPANVKRWTPTRMATQFQKFKQQLDKYYIKKNLGRARRSTTIILVEVDMHLQCPSGGRWKKTFSHKVPYRRSLIGPSE